MKYAGKLSRMGRRGLIDTNEVKCKANALPEGTMLRLSVTVARMTPKTLFIFAALAMGNYAASTTSRPFPSFLTKIVCFFNSAWRSCAMKKNDGKRPSFQFYPADWMKDPALKLCSHNAKGIWMDLICIAFEMPTKGVFLISKKPISEIKLLQMLNGNEKSKKSGFQELKRHGVIKRNKDNVFYCKRLYNDMRLSEIRREVGKLGGNPDLLNQNDNQSPTPSSSSSSSSSISSFNNPPMPPNGFEQFWKKYPRKIGKQAALKVWKKIKPSEAFVAKIITAVEQQKKCEQWLKNGGQYIPHPKTWLNEGRWDDEMQSKKTIAEIMDG